VQEFPETRHSLLVRVQLDDAEAWDEFAKIYRPVFYRLARRRGWQDADAQDVAQKVLIKVATAIQGFRLDDSRAKFRTWLTTVCRNALVDELRRWRPDAAPGGPDGPEALELLVFDAELSEADLSLEHRRQVFRWAAAEAASTFAQSTWQAFWLTAVEGTPARHVAQQLGMSAGAVYTARSRVMQFLKQKVQEYDDAEL
jgi:RNA polymerase sigma-70 factor (ECF subfamily)